MKYVFSVEPYSEVARVSTETEKKEGARMLRELLARLKAEVSYFSTTRRFAFLVVNVEDPHVELRKIYETLSTWGNVTVDPVSNVEEFIRYLEK